MNRERHIQNLSLVGFMGTGKSTVGKLLSEQLQYHYIDTDEMLEHRAGKSISAIFETEGEEKFRAREQALVQELSTCQRCVISTGGGLAAHNNNLELLKSFSIVICLWASPETIWERVRHQHHRPLLKDADPLQRIKFLLTQREPFYKKSDILISTENRHSREVVQHVLHQYQLARTPIQ
ncbi:MAG: Shikimate kinase [Verrucomicrobiales bacterium]|nr:Shikimate kinase [Verrucomicrobiales bacterium]MDB6130243.1 Shikimate kinase [Verrucomicrobiales bacterium]